MAPRPTRPLPISDPDEVRSALEGVQERDRRVVELRYGLEDGRQHSRAEIGRLLGISRERVRQLETRALDLLSAHASGSQGQERRAHPARASGPAPSRQSFLRSFILMLLCLSPAHVYELRGRMRELGLPPATYRLLQTLERQGYLRSTWAPGRGAGPNRRVYSLTSRGLDQLQLDAEALAKVGETIELLFADQAVRPPVDADAPA